MVLLINFTVGYALKYAANPPVLKMRFHSKMRYYSLPIFVLCCFSFSVLFFNIS